MTLQKGRATVVDVHHHYLPADVCSELRARADGAPRLDDGLVNMSLTDALDDVEARLKLMNTVGVDMALLSCSGVSVYGVEFCRRLNKGMAELQSNEPTRFRACAHISISEPESAAVELERCIDDYGMVAVALPTGAGTVQLDDPRLTPLWEKITFLSLPIVLHPPLGSKWAPSEYSIERSCARPIETTMAMVRLMSAVLPRFSELKVVVPHCGGAAPFLRGRLQMFYDGPNADSGNRPRTRSEQAESGIAESFSRAWSCFYFDTAGTGGWVPVVRLTGSVVGENRLMFGSDYPLESHSVATFKELLEMFAPTEWPDQARRAIVGGTASELFSL